jgi:hypothetical protein
VADDAGRFAAPAVIVVIGFAVAGTVWWGVSLSHRHWITAAARPVLVSVQAPAMPALQDQPVHLAAAAEASAAHAVAPEPAQAIAVARGQIDAVFTYSATSWTEVYDATGRRLLYGLSTGPGTHKLEGVPPLSVILGDANDVTIEIAGRPASISRFVRSDHSARFLIAADGRALAVPRKNGG